MASSASASPPMPAKKPSRVPEPRDGARCRGLYTDSWRSYRPFAEHHEFVDHSAVESVRGDVHTNSIESAWSLFDRPVIASYHKLSKKHLSAYLKELEFRFNH